MKRRSFSIIEVIASLAVLTMGVVALLNMQTQAVARSSDQKERLNEHLLFTQAVEFFLLAGPDKIMTSDVWEAENYTATCTELDLQEEQPEDGIDMSTQLTTSKIKTLKIDLLYRGNVVKSMNYNIVESTSEE